MAEWSKALVSGTSLLGRGFESLCCQTFLMGLLCNRSSTARIKKTDGDEGDRTPGISEGTHPYFKWPFGHCFLFQSEKKHISGHN